MGKHVYPREVFESVVRNDFYNGMYEIDERGVVYNINFKVENIDVRMGYCIDKALSDFFNECNEMEINWCLFDVMTRMYKEGKIETAQEQLEFVNKFNDLYNKLRNKYECGSITV